MNDTLIIQYASGHKYMGLTSLWFSNLVEYCKIHKMDYWLHGGPVRYWDKAPFRAWAKLALVQQALLQNYEKVICLDVDLFIQDMTVDLREACVKPFNMVKWWKGRATEHFQAGAIFFNNKTDQTLITLSRLLEEAKYYVERNPTERGWLEQGQLNELAVDPRCSHLFYELPIRYNWCQRFCQPCDDPVIVSYHGVKPIGLTKQLMAQDIQKSQVLVDDGIFTLLRLVVAASTGKKEFDDAFIRALDYLEAENIIEREEGSSTNFIVNNITHTVVSEGWESPDEKSSPA